MTGDAQGPKRGALIVVAAVAGILAGAAAVYVSALNESNVSLTAADCASALEAAARAAPLAKGEVAAFQIATTPDPLDDLVFSAPDGSKSGVAALAGKTLLVNFWATWCVPCRAEMPTLNQLAAERNGPDFQVVTVDLDVGDAAKRAPAFLSEIGVDKLPDYADPSGALLITLKKRGLALGLPTTVLIDANGCRVGKMEGPAEWNSPDARALIEAAIGRAPAVKPDAAGASPISG